MSTTLDLRKYHPITKEHEWFRGEQKTLQFTVKNEDDTDVEDISGWTIKWYVRKNKSSTTNELEIDAPATSPTSGICQAQTTAADTQDIEAGKYWHELWRVDVGFEAVLSYGPAVLQ